MVQLLQKNWQKLVVFCLLSGMFTADSFAQLNTLWERTALTGAEAPVPDWFEAGYVRGIAYVDGRIYAADRTNSKIRVLDAETGADITLETDFNLSGVSGGTYPMNDIEVSTDGKVFLGNLSTNTVDTAASPFKLYIFDAAGGDPVSTYSLQTPNVLRMGDKFTVIGSLTDNTIEIWIPAAGSNPGKVYILTTTDQGSTWDTEVVDLTGTDVSIPSNAGIAPMGLGRTSDFYIAGNGSAPKRYTSTGAYIEGSIFPSDRFTTGRNGLQAFSINSKDYLSVYTYKDDPEVGTNTNNTGRVYVYDVSDPLTFTMVNSSPLMGDDVSTYSSIHGEALASINADSTYNIYALDGVNGLAAYTSEQPETPANLFFSEYIEGSGNNKALEIFNNTDSTVALSNYQIAESNNGTGWIYYHIFADSAVIEAGSTYVLITDQVADTLFAAADADEVLAYPSPIHFNGNDARAIIHIDPVFKDTTFLDVFGDPFSANNWDVAGVTAATVEHTLWRKATVTEGNTTVLASFGTDEESSEWIVGEQNDFSNLGALTPLYQPLSGTYYIPQGTNDKGFATLAEAIDVVNEYGLSGETTFLLDSDLDEIDQLRFNRGDLSESTRLTIKPADGKQVKITTKSFRFVDTGFITVDGSSNGTDSRDLTIENTGTSNAIIGFYSNTLNITFKNLNVTYADTVDASNTYAILANRRESSGDTGRSENLVIENVKIGTPEHTFRDAIWVLGSTSIADHFQLNTSILNNEMYVGRSAFRSQTHINTVISGNKIKVYSQEAGGVPAINLNTPIENFTFINNEISFVSNTSVDSTSFVGVNATNTLINTVLIANNTFTNAGFTGAGTSDSFYAFRHEGSSTSAKFQLYHNTVKFTEAGEAGIHTVVGASATASSSASMDIKNNIFVNERDAANSYIYQWENDALTSDFNNIVISASGSVALVGGNTSGSLADWIEDSANDSTSTEVAVTFVSDSDLRLSGASIGDDALAGIPIASVATDIDGTERSTTAPYKGAFEGSIPLLGEDVPEIGAFALVSPADDSTIVLTGIVNTVLEISWEMPSAPDSVTFTWYADTVGGDFSNPILSYSADDAGSTNKLTLTYGTLHDTLDAMGVSDGSSIDIIWNVKAKAGVTERFAEASFNLTLFRDLSVSTEIDDKPEAFTLYQNYPNPFNPTSNIKFTLPATVQVRLDVYNINGQLVATLVNSKLNAGEHVVQFDGKGLASGVYLYRIVAGKHSEMKRMTLIK